MHFEQVGEENQKILYKHYMDTGEIKDCLLTKIWPCALQWFFTYENCLIEQMQISTENKVQGYNLFRQEYQGQLVIDKHLQCNRLNLFISDEKC